MKIISGTFRYLSRTNLESIIDIILSLVSAATSVDILNGIYWSCLYKKIVDRNSEKAKNLESFLAEL